MRQRPPKNESRRNRKKIMKTLTLLAVTSLLATGTSFAADVLHSPRGLANVTRTVPGVTDDNLYRGPFYKHRGDLAAPTMVASDGIKDFDYVHNAPMVAASPRALATFPDLAKTALISGDTVACVCDVR